VGGIGCSSDVGSEGIRPTVAPGLARQTVGWTSTSLEWDSVPVWGRVPLSKTFRNRWRSAMRTFNSIGWLLAVGTFFGHGALGAQETLMEGDLRHGGFGAPVVKFTQVDDRFGVLVGGRGGWIINGSFVVGGGGYGLANLDNFEHVTNASGDRGRLSMGYGGLELTYVLRPDELVHLSLGVLIGAGGVVWNPLGQSGKQEDDPFFITEPELDVVLNVTTFMRAGFGVSYRFVRGVELLDLRDGDVSGLGGVVALQFGSF